MARGCRFKVEYSPTRDLSFRLSSIKSIVHAAVTTGARCLALENHSVFVTLADLLNGASPGISAARAPDTRAIVPRKALIYRPWT